LVLTQTRNSKFVHADINGMIDTIEITGTIATTAIVNTTDIIEIDGTIEITDIMETTTA